MAENWKPDYPLTEEQVTAIAKRYLPLAGTPAVQYLGDGCDFDAYRVNEFVLRFPKRNEYIPYYYNEVKLLDKLSEYGHPWIPKYVGLWKDLSLYPYPFGAYSYMSGTTGHSMPYKMCQRDVELFVNFLEVIHSIDESKLVEWGVLAGDYVWDISDKLETIRDDLAWLSENYRTEETKILIRLRDTVANTQISDVRVLTHTDLLPEHIIVNPLEGNIVGVIDWADSMLCDPAADFIGLYLWQGREITEEVRERYGRDLGQNFWERIRFNAYRCMLGELRYGLERQRQTYIDGAIRWLRNFEADS